MAVCLYAHQFVTENNKKSNFAQQPPKPSNHGWFGFKKNHCFDLLIEFTWLKRTLWILKFRRCRCPFPQEKLSIFHILGKPIPWTYKGKLFDTCFLPQFVFFFSPFRFIQILWGFCFQNMATGHFLAAPFWWIWWTLRWNLSWLCQIGLWHDPARWNFGGMTFRTGRSVAATPIDYTVTHQKVTYILLVEARCNHQSIIFLTKKWIPQISFKAVLLHRFGWKWPQLYLEELKQLGMASFHFMIFMSRMFFFGILAWFLEDVG